MPANLTPDYERAEEKYRAATDDDSRLAALREMFATIPKHKGTEKLQADLKRKISQMRKAVAHKPSKGPDLFHVPRSGAGQVVLCGLPNTGKSSLVGKLTHAPVKIGDYPFTTTLPVPGMCSFEDVQIELVDTPPFTADHVVGGLMGTIRAADIIAVVVDASADPLEEAQAALDVFDGRGMQVRTARVLDLDPSNPAEHSILIIANKSDLVDPGNIAALHDLYADHIEVYPTSTTTGAGLPELVHRLWELLCMIRVYTKEPGKAAEKSKPFALPLGSTVEDLAHEIHRDLPQKMRFARLWGAGHISGQQVHRTEELHDGDTVEIHE
jgi:ribosome-interacting GTPase 1